jgi:ubiquinone/menaquinone biosynthesis C-methylase UbiE
VSEQIKLVEPNAKILAADLSPIMIAQQLIRREAWADVETAILDVRNLLGLKDNTFTHVITNFGMLVPDDLEVAVKVVREVFRVLKPEGVAVIANWAGTCKIGTRSLILYVDFSIDRVWLEDYHSAARCSAR